MEDHLASVYLMELEHQTNFARNAALQINAALAALGGPSGRTAHREVFRGVHSLLTHAGNISRLLWPSPKSNATSQKRAEDLRGLLGFPADAHVLKDRTLRNDLEHFEQRLDEWAVESAGHNIVQDYIGPPSAIVGIDPKDRMRAYDPATKTFVFRGEEYALGPIVEQGLPELQQAVRTAQVRLADKRKPHRGVIET